MNWQNPNGLLGVPRGKFLRNALLVSVFFIYISFFFPFWKPIVAGIIFASGCSPMVTWLKNKLNVRRNSSSVIFLVFTSTFIMGGLALFFTSVYSFISAIAKDNKQLFSTDFSVTLTKFEEKIVTALGIQDVPMVKEIFETVKKAAENVDSLLTAFAQATLQEVPDFLMYLFIFFLVFFGIILYRAKIWTVICDLLDAEGNEVNLITKFETMCARTLASIFVIGIIQSFLVIIGISLSGTTKSLLFLFNITFLFSLIPVLGAAIVPFVLSVAGFLDGNATAGIILLITAGLAGSIDNVLKGVFFSRAANSNPLLSLIALLGSLVLFGFVGLFIAPLLEQIIMSYLDYKKEQKIKLQTSGEI